MLLSKAKDPAFWQTVRTDAAYQPIIDHLRSIYESSFYNEIPALPYHARMRFYSDGDRSEFEAPYFRRRAFLASAALLFLIYPDETHYLDEVHRVLWAICDEYTWALPAHTDGTLEDDLSNVDLFNAETGFTLAELCYVLGDRLDPLVRARAKQEVRKRVIQNYLNRTFWWDTGTNNWAAVCAGNVGGAMMYLEPDIFKSLLTRRFPNSVQLLPPSYSVYWKGNVTWMQSLRNLLYVDFHAIAPEKRLENYDLPQAGQVIINEAAYSLAAKAGDNDEPHNHNDVGSFILSTNQGQILCDLGAGTYTRQYFRSETRYTIFCNSSLSHSVPIVNGQPQLPGKEYNGTIAHDGNVITIDFAAAYGQPGFNQLIRRLEYFTDKIVLTDSFASDYESLTERFVTSFKPQVRPDSVVIGGITLHYDPSLVTLSIKEEAHQLHGFKGEMETIYCLDFELKPELKEIQFVIQI